MASVFEYVGMMPTDSALRGDVRLFRAQSLKSFIERTVSEHDSGHDCAVLWPEIGTLLLEFAVALRENVRRSIAIEIIGPSWQAQAT